jgi:hypothetical protein
MVNEVPHTAGDTSSCSRTCIVRDSFCNGPAVQVQDFGDAYSVWNTATKELADITDCDAQLLDSVGCSK